MRRALRANLLATAVAGPVGALVQRHLSFEILGFDPGTPPLLRALGLVLAVLLLGQLTGLIAGVPVDRVVARLAPRWRWSAVPLSAGLAVALFAATLAWELRASEIVLLLALTATFFGVRRACLAKRVAPASVPPTP